MQPTVERPRESMQHARRARSFVAIVATLTLAVSVTAQAQTDSSDARKGAAQSATKPASAAQSATKAASPGANPVTATRRPARRLARLLAIPLATRRVAPPKPRASASCKASSASCSSAWRP
jgi:hypothetical protein